MVPYGQSAPGSQNQNQQQQQQQQQFQGQAVWSPQGPNGLQPGQQAPQVLGYGQNAGQGYDGRGGGQGQQHMQGWPQQQPNAQHLPQQHGQPQQQQSYQQYQVRHETDGGTRQVFEGRTGRSSFCAVFSTLALNHFSFNGDM